MGIFDNIFGGNQAKSKFDIIKRFAKERAKQIGSDPNHIDSLDTMMLEGLPESNIVTIVESYFIMKNQGLDDYTILKNIEDHRSSFDPYPNSNPFPSNPNLKNYVYFRLEFELPSDSGFNIEQNGFTREFIEKIIDESVRFYSK